MQEKAQNVYPVKRTCINKYVEFRDKEANLCRLFDSW